MNLGSTLSDLANRFTNDDQVKKLKDFADSTTGISQTVRNQLLGAVERSQANLVWDKERLTEMTTYWKKFQGDASTIVTSFIALILSVIAILVVN